MKKERLQFKTPEVIKHLAAKFPSPSYAFLTQVRNGTGYERNARTADAMAMSLWPSRGMDIIGFEVKVSRSDWMRELMLPEKAEGIAQFCDQWYIVVGDEMIVQEGELPSAWGLMVPCAKKGLRIVKEAPQLEKPKPVDKLMLASILRNTCERTISKDAIESEMHRNFERGKESAKYEIERTQKENQELKESIEMFEKHSGVRISTWKDSNRELGIAVKEVMENRHKKTEAQLIKLRDTAKNILKFIDGEIKSYEI